MGLAGEVLVSGLGAALTDTLFNPLEMLKVRVQLSEQPLALPQAAAHVFSRGGMPLLWLPGLQVTWVRAFSVTGVRIGLYPSVRRACGDGGVATQAAAGMLTGALSAGMASPLDLVRTRLHAQVGERTRYPSAWSVVREVVRHEGGARALWRGIGATVARQALLSGGQLASYDTSKRLARERLQLREETPALHVACAAFSGLVAQTCCMPADVLKVRVLSGEYASVAEAAAAVLRKEGLAGFYRGFVPAVVRQVPVITIQLPLIEALRRWAGLGQI